MTTIKAEVIDPTGMTCTESKVLEKLCEGLSNKAIANTLSITAKTVETHIDHLYRKNSLTWASINRRSTLIVTAISKGVVKITINSVVLAICLQSVVNDSPALRTRNARAKTTIRITQLRRCE